MIDLRTLSPLDMAPVYDSVRRTGHAVVVHEAHVNLGMGSEIAARITEECFYSLEAPVLRVGGFDTPYPPSRIEEECLPDLDRVLDAVDRVARLLTTALRRPMPEYKLPDVGEGLTEAEIVTWKVKVGDVIAINDIVVEIETAKSLVELPSPYAGTVTGLLVPEGETVAVGTPIIAIAAEGEAPAPAAPAAPAADAAGRPRRDRPVQPARERRRRGREPGRPQQGRARLPAPAAQGHLARGGRRASTRPTSRSQASFVPGSWCSPEVVEADEPAVPASTPEAPRCRCPRATATCARWPSLRCASWPRTSASTSPR